jgi:arsenate reductase
MSTSTITRRHTDDCLRSPEAHTIAAPVAATVATTLKAMADPLRLRMLALIATSPGGEACVCDLSEVAADVSQPTVSHHLKVLKDVGVLTSERRATWVYYRITPAFGPAVRSLLETFVPAARDAATDPHELTGLTDVDCALTAVADDLAGHHPDVPASQVLQTVRESYTGLARNATTRSYLVPLTRRFADQRLTDLRAATQAVPRAPQVLFVCVANAGRSQLAAALVEYYARDRVVVRSAGSAPAGHVHSTVRPLLDELGADRAFPKPLTDDAVRAADVVITMGCGDVCPVVPGVRYENWIVGDPAVASPEGVAAIRAEIHRRVRALLTDLIPDLTLPDPEQQPHTVPTVRTDQETPR